jgi:glycerophosphoryl diester phosphodiesterase
VVGHRGAAAHAPENTLASIRKAHELGCNWVEFDVALTSDDVPVLLHDETLDRTTGGNGRIGAVTFERLRRLDAGRWKGPAFAGERVPTLQEALELMAELGMEANVEIKPEPGREVRTAEVTCQTILAWCAGERPLPLVSSFALGSLRAARDCAADLPLGYLVEAVPGDWRGTMEELGCVSLHVSHRRNSDRTLEAVAGEGVPLLCYTVNENRRAQRLFELGVASVFSDAPDRIAAPGQ